MFTKWDIYVSDTEFKKLKNLTNKAKVFTKISAFTKT